MNAYNRPGETDAIKSVPDPGPDTLAETIANLGANVTQAARREERAKAALRDLRPGNVMEKAAEGWIAQAKVEQAHWREYLQVYRTWLTVHPELADKPVGTRCAHGPRCTLDSPVGQPKRSPPEVDRVPGSDDDDDFAPPHWSDGEANP